MARLAIGKEFLAEYAKLDRDTRSAVDTAIAEFARQTHAGPFLETPRYSRDSRIRTIGIDGAGTGEPSPFLPPGAVLFDHVRAGRPTDLVMA